LSETSLTRRSERALAVIAHRGFTLSLLISGALLLGVLALGWKARWLDWAELVLGLAMAAEGVLLATNWRGARKLTLWRLQRRRSARRAQGSLRSRIVWRLASPALELLGVVWIGAGTLTAALGLGRIV
jgi:membrane-bound metal-dependent hydrolase YbcI (DUF457 family)